METASDEPPQAIVIQAPAPREPEEEVVPSQAAAPAPVPPPQRRIRRDEHSRPNEASPEPQPASSVPAMEPGEGTERPSELRSKVSQTQQQIERRIALLRREGLSPTEREVLDGARGFLQQSLRALNESDFERASNLAHKADLLVQAIEQSR